MKISQTKFIFFPFKAKEFFFFAGLLGVVTVIFAIMAWFYRYVNYGCSRTVEGSGDDDSDGMDEFDHVPLLPEKKESPGHQLPTMKIDRPVRREVIQQQTDLVDLRTDKEASIHDQNNPFYGQVQRIDSRAKQQQSNDFPSQTDVGQQEISQSK